MKTFAGRFGIGQWSFIGPGSEEVVSFREQSPRSLGPHCGRKVAGIRKSGHPIFRATTPLSRGQLKSKGRGKLSIHFSADPDTIIQFIALFFLSISSVSTGQWQLYARNLKTIKIERGNL